MQSQHNWPFRDQYLIIPESVVCGTETSISETSQNQPISLVPVVVNFQRFHCTNTFIARKFKKLTIFLPLKGPKFWNFAYWKVYRIFIFYPSLMQIFRSNDCAISSGSMSTEFFYLVQFLRWTWCKGANKSRTFLFFIQFHFCAMIFFMGYWWTIENLGFFLFFFEKRPKYQKSLRKMQNTIT